MQPTEDQFKDWQSHPVTEWVLRLCEKHGQSQREEWAKKAWEAGEVLPDVFQEARVRADCYDDLAKSSYEDWKTIDDTATE